MSAAPALPVAAFALATLLPLPLLAAGALAGGWLALAGVLWMTALIALLDQALPWVAGDAPEGAEFPAADRLLVLLGGLHLLALPLATLAIAGPGPLALWERAALFAGFGLWFGQVSVPAAHELIHRGGRGLQALGVAIYVSLLFGHHASAHRLVHHRHAASPADPNTARAGEGYYRFALRAWVGSFVEGWRAERRLRGPGRLTPYPLYLGGAALSLSLAALLAGWPGLLVWAGLAAHAQSQLLLSDYVQHYGLRRRTLPDGRLEPVGPRHSWNAPHWLSAATMLNAPRHSDHHAHPSRPYPALRLGDVPMLPLSLPAACTLALVPPLWRRIMRAPLAAWVVRT